MNLKTFASSFVLSLLIIQSSAFSMSASEEELLRQQSSAVSQHKLSDFMSPRGQHVLVKGNQTRHSKVMRGKVESIIVDRDGRSLTVKGWAAFKGKGAPETIVAFSNRVPVALIPSSESSEDIAEHIATLATEEGDQFTKADYSRCRFNAQFSYPDTDALDGEDDGFLKFYALKDNEGGYIKIARKAFTFKELLLDPKSTIEQDEPVLFQKLTNKANTLETRIDTAFEFPTERQLEAFCTLLSDRDHTYLHREFIKGHYTIPEKVSTALETINDSSQLVQERLKAVRRLPELTRVRVLRSIIDEVLDPTNQYTTDKEDLEIRFHNTLLELPQGKDTEAFLIDIVNEQKFPLRARFSAASLLPNGDELLFAFFKDKKLEVTDRNKAANMIKDKDLKIKWFRGMIHDPDLDSLDRMFAAIQLDGIPIKDENDEDFKALIRGVNRAEKAMQLLDSGKRVLAKLSDAKRAQVEAIQRGDIRVQDDGRYLLVREY
ncbi:MAG: hypothetical protein K2Y08_01210 [Alphaproteobacteria bacterium]|nr:hypothetical protein [Alphaproteobacteria bacterium]